MFVRGDIVKVNLNPVTGNEQGNYRPVLVMNGFPLPGGVNIVLPITSHKKNFLFEVDLDERCKTHGVVLCFQIRPLDLDNRDAVFIEHIPDDITNLCSEYAARAASDID